MFHISFKSSTIKMSIKQKMIDYRPCYLILTHTLFTLEITISIMLVTDLHLTEAVFQKKWSWEIFSKWFFANLWSWAPSLSCQWDTSRSTNDQQLFFQFIHSKENKRVTILQLFVHLSIILVNIIKHIRSLEMLQLSHQQTNNRSLFWNRDWSYPQLWLASIWN